jgi:hypothetical protein
VDEYILEPSHLSLQGAVSAELRPDFDTGSGHILKKGGRGGLRYEKGKMNENIKG